MGINECFAILGLSETNDEKEIKNAYRSKLAVTNPEDDPEGFKRLRNAYEEIIEYLKKPAVGTLDEKDETPSGLWVEKAKEIYNSMSKRRDIECWKELLNDEVLDSLEEESACREKLLVFIMDNFRLPTEVWRMLDDKLGISKDEEELRNLFPVDFINYVLRCCLRGEDLDFDYFEGEDDAPYDDFCGLYNACWSSISAEKYDEAKKIYEESKQLNVFHPAMEICYAIILNNENPEEANEFVRNLWVKYPDCLTVIYNSAEILWKNGCHDEAAKAYNKIRENDEDHYMSNRRLAEWNYDNGNYEEAKTNAKNVLSGGADDEFMELLMKINSKLEEEMEKKWEESDDWEAALDYCWCLFQDKRVSAAHTLACKLKDRISYEREAEYVGLLSKLNADMGCFEESVKYAKEWEKLLIRDLDSKDEKERGEDEDRINQSHIIRIQCNSALGFADEKYFKDALEEIENLNEKERKDIGLQLEVARIYYDMREYEKGAEAAEKLIASYAVYAAAAVAMDCYRRMWDASGVYRNARICIDNFPQYVHAYDCLGRVYLDMKEYDKLDELVKEAETNEVNSRYLKAYQYLKNKEIKSVEDMSDYLDKFDKEVMDPLRAERRFDCYEKDLEQITTYFYMCPGSYLLSWLGDFYIEHTKLDEAAECFEEALRDAPAYTYCYARLSFIFRLQGDFEKAIFNRRKAMLYSESNEPDGYAHISMAQNYVNLCEYDEALKHYEEASRIDTSKKSQYLSIARCYARKGDLKNALKNLGEYFAGCAVYEDGKIDKKQYYFTSEILEELHDFKLWDKNLREWKSFIERVTPGVFNGDYSKAAGRESDYFIARATYDILQGDYDKAMESLEIIRKINPYVPGFTFEDEEIMRGLDDILIYSIMYKDGERWKKYSEEFKLILAEYKERNYNKDIQAPKQWLEYRLLANFFDYGPEKVLDMIHDEGENALWCEYCIYPTCRELKVVEILALMELGRIDEAFEMTIRLYKVQPFDTYIVLLKRKIEEIKGN